MKLLHLTLSTLLPLAVYAQQQPAQLRLFPDPAPSATHAGTNTVTLSAPQANAVLAHHLGVAQYEQLPPSGKDKSWEQALGDVNGPWTATQGPKLVILLECGSEGCQDLIPDTFAQSTAYSLPSLPVHSWTAALTLHLHRLADSLGLDASSPAIVGLQELTQSLKAIKGWMGWVGTELGGLIGWDELKETVKAAVEPVRQSLGFATDAELLDPSAALLVDELESLSTLADTFAASRTSDDEGPQSQAPQVVALHLKGMNAISAANAASSKTYRSAANLLRQTLTATLASFSAANVDSPEQPTLIFISLPPYSPPLLRKRAAWLKPFEAGTSRYVAHKRAASSSGSLHKRAHNSDEGRIVKRAESTAQPIVPSSKRCFESLSQLNNLTATCLGRGKGVKGLSTRGKDCWVCSCSPTTENGKRISWAGEGCEKQDLSGDFVLLFFSGLGLIVVLFVSVKLLYNVGNVELPGTLAAVSGAGASSKRD